MRLAEATGIRTHDHHRRARATGDELANGSDRGRVTPVEADDQLTRRSRPSGDHLVELGLGERQRLLAEDVLARLECICHERGVAVVGRRDEHGVDVGVAEQGVDRRCNPLEPGLLREQAGREPGLGGDRYEAIEPGLLHGRQERDLCV